jgi:predicted nucleotidyltransferase
MLLDKNDKQALVQIFSEVPVPIEVWAYGSRVNGTAHEGSDLDLVIRGKGPKVLALEITTELCEKIRDSNIPILVELRSWSNLPDRFRRNIEQNYEVLFDSLWSSQEESKENRLNEPPAEYKPKHGKGGAGDKERGGE